jgi:DNA-binding transcriptional ArsR family regulator
MESRAEKSFIEKILGSRTRYRILKYLLKKGGANINRIAEELNITYPLVKRYLEDMVSMGIIEEIKLGRTRYFTPAWTNPRLKILKEIIESEEEPYYEEQEELYE